MSRKAGLWIALVWGGVFCVFALAGGMGAGYFANKGFFFSTIQPAVSLSGKYSFSGPLKEKDLKFSRLEIITLNNSAWRTRDVLIGMDIQVEVDPWDGRMDGDDLLQYTFEFNTSDGGMVKTWPKETMRKRLVRELERHLDTAADECRRCREKKVDFKALYI